MKKIGIVCLLAALLMAGCGDPEVAEPTVDPAEPVEPVLVEPEPEPEPEPELELVMDDSPVIFQLGDESEEILAMQAALYLINYDVDETGILDEKTEMAIAAFKLTQEDLMPNQECTEWTRDRILSEADRRLIKDPMNLLVLANKEYYLPSDFAPDDMVQPDVYNYYEEKRELREPAARALEELFAACKEETGVKLVFRSGFRSYDTQKIIFERHVANRGFEAANQVSAKPGQSEHQTGLAADITSWSVKNALEEEFGETPEGIWVAENAHRFGFIIRYKIDTVDITKYQYEPWHLRYVGPEDAAKIYQADVTLEEYLGEL
jgi:D-alanyl-D-alanine carboxypeptidase